VNGQLIVELAYNLTAPLVIRQAVALLLCTEDEVAAASYVFLLVCWATQSVGVEDGLVEEILLTLLRHPLSGVRSSALHALAEAAGKHATEAASLRLATRSALLRHMVLEGLESEGCCHAAAQLICAIASGGGSYISALRPWRAWLECHAHSRAVGSLLSGALALLAEWPGERASQDDGDVLWSIALPHMRALFSKNDVRRFEGAVALRALLEDAGCGCRPADGSPEAAGQSEAAAEDPLRALLDGGAAANFHAASSSVNARVLARFTDKVCPRMTRRFTQLEFSLGPNARMD
jgi:hypothetical protein